MKRWQENGGLLGIAICSGDLDLAQMAQAAGKMGGEGNQICMVQGVSCLMKVGERQ